MNTSSNMVVGLLGVASLISTLSSGCIMIMDDDGGGGYTHYNSQPLIVDSNLFVGCSYDYQYADYRWDFQAYVDDADGPLDIYQVYVNVMDMYYSYSEPAETWELAYDGNGWWSNTIYEYYSDSLFCEELYYSYEFDFYAADHEGATDSVTYVP